MKHQNAAGVRVPQTTEMTGFIDQATDQVTYGLPKPDPITAQTVCENQPLVLHNRSRRQAATQVRGTPERAGMRGGYVRY